MHVVSVSISAGLSDGLLGLLFVLEPVFVPDDVDEGTMCDGIASGAASVEETGPTYATARSFKLATRKERYCPTLGM